MTIDPAAIARRIKPDKQLAQLKTRPLDTLVPASAIAGTGRAQLLLDTNVYIHEAAGTLPAAAQAVLDQCVSFHSSVCIAELTTGVANGDPAHPRWAAKRDHYFGLIRTIPEHRLLTPDAEIWAEAGLIAGTLSRVQGFQPHQRKACLNDALIYLSAAREGISVLTANRAEFDLIQQLGGRGNFVYF
ncbi:MAG: type II toxin-antitoxin system VapC family toxin [Allosphingosinicella sp.]